ncbi:MAG: type I-F CRISPR-associated protein Csy1 [bacterium]|nr:type I-F CRISPR-associated protein Csy1 [bacterium]
MDSITGHQIRLAIGDFLAAELETTLKKETAQLKNKTESAVENKRQKLAPRYETGFFLTQLNASLEFMRAQKLNLATHTAKGIHSALQTDNVILLAKEENSGIVSSRTVQRLCIDATSNNTGSHSGHLKNIVDFLNVPVAEGRIYQAVLSNNPAIRDLFSAMGENGEENLLFLVRCLQVQPVNLSTGERSKQLLFPAEADAYVCLIPLYPSSLVNHVFHTIHGIRYSDDARLAKQQRQKDDATAQKSYSTVHDLAVINLGGANSQNVSRLNNQQSGRNFLLPSLPPVFNQQHAFQIGPSDQSFFNKKLRYLCRAPLQKLFALVADDTNTFFVRESRKTIINTMLDQVLWLAASIQGNSPPGWSKKGHALHYKECLWLDPGRAELEGEEDFAEDREQKDWRGYVATRLANWLNALLKKEFEHMRYDFGDAVQKEWRSSMEEVIQKSRREGREVFV